MAVLVDELPHPGWTDLLEQSLHVLCGYVVPRVLRASPAATSISLESAPRVS